MSWDDIADDWGSPPSTNGSGGHVQSPQPFTWPDVVPSFPRRPSPPVDDGEFTVHRSVVATTAPTLELRDGTRVVLGASVVVVGRRPTQEDGVTPVVVAADSVSRTHFAVGLKADKVWVQDRDSTNGTRIVNAEGQSVDLTPGRRTLVPLPIRIEFGEESARITG